MMMTKTYNASFLEVLYNTEGFSECFNVNEQTWGWTEKFRGK